MQPFTFHAPTKITFGEDTACGIGDTLNELGVKRPLIITDANLIKAGVLASLLEALKEAGFGEPIIFDQVPADSDLTAVRNATRTAQKAGCDGIIAVGGGSVMDTGKVANIGLTLKRDVLEYEGMNTLSGRLRPFIAIPTTAGTGSEVSAVAMIKNHKDKKKLFFGSRFLFPDVAILDPKLLLSLPAKLTAATGLDALTHAIESYTAMTRNAPSDGLCLEAMRLIFASLPRATQNGKDVEARSLTLVGSMIAGLAFTNAGVGIVHALSHSFGAKYGSQHGLTNAVFLPWGMEFNIDTVSDRYSSAYTFLCSSFNETTAQPANQWFSVEPKLHKENHMLHARELIQAVRNLITSCNLPVRLRDIGVPELNDEDIAQIANISLTDPAIMFNAKMTSLDDLIGIIKRAY